MAAARAELMTFLDHLGIATETVEHPPLFTVEESRRLRGAIAGGHSKNLFLKDKRDRLWLVVAEEEAPVDLKTFHKRIGADRLSFGKPDLLMETLGVVPGAVTPFGLLNDRAGRVGVVVDAGLLAHGRVNFHPLENTATTAIASDDLLKFLRATGHEPQVIALGEGLAAG